METHKKHNAEWLLTQRVTIYPAKVTRKMSLVRPMGVRTYRQHSVEPVRLAIRNATRQSRDVPEARRNRRNAGSNEAWGTRQSSAIPEKKRASTDRREEKEGAAREATPCR